MVAAARSLPRPRHMVSPAIHALMQRRAAELTGLALGCGGLAVLVALVSYNPSDPSLNTSTTHAATNLAGPVGAVVSDLLLQGFGVFGAVPGLAMLAWAWRIASRRGLGSVAVRLAVVATAMPLAGAAVSAIPQLATVAWPASAGPGGAIGRILAPALLEPGRGLLGPVGAVLVWIILAALAMTLLLLALGISGSEWRATWRAAARIARFSISTGWSAASLLARITSPFVRMTTAAVRLLHRRPAERSTAAETEPRLSGLRPADQPQGVAPTIHARMQTTASRKPRQESLPLPEAGWRFPALSLLKPAPARAATGPSTEALEANARLLETVLSDYGVQGSIVEIRPGPVVTLYELEPAPGIRSARVIGLADDVARSLSVTAVRIATVPGRNVIGIEVPNAKRETVFLSELLASDEVQRHPARLLLTLGKDISGAPVVADLQRMPHLMIAGTTGSGKSVGVNAMILSLLYRLSPDQCRLILIDPKMLELSMYEGIPHLMAPVVTEPAKAVTALKWTVREMERRYRAMSSARCAEHRRL